MDFLIVGLYVALAAFLLWPAACLAENRIVPPGWVFGEDMGNRILSVRFQKLLNMNWVDAVQYRVQLAAITAAYVLFLGPLVWQFSPYAASVLYWIDAWALGSLVLMRFSSDGPGGPKAISRVAVFLVVAASSFWACDTFGVWAEGAYAAYMLASVVAWSFTLRSLVQKIVEVPRWAYCIIRRQTQRWST